MAPRKQRKEMGQPTTSTPVEQDQTSENINILTQNLQQVSQMIANLTQNVSSLTSNSSTANNAATMPSTSRVNINQPIPPYDPSDEVASIERFINNIDQLATINNWDELTTIYMATSNLQGLARTWYNSQKRLDYTWEEWKSIMRTAFPEDVDYQSLLFKILNRTKRQDENMITYYYEKMSLIDSFNFEDKVAVNLLIGGLKNTEIQAAAKACRHQTPTSLLQFLKTFKDKEEFTHSKNTVKRMLPKRGRTYRTFSTTKPIKCYACGQEGHIAPNCPQKKGQIGKPLLATKDNQVNLNEKYFMHVLLNNQSVRAFIDFGSSVMTINQATVKELNVNSYDNEEYIRGYGGGVVRSVGTTSPITIEIDEFQAKLKFLIVPNAVQDIPVIIGQPFTELSGLVVYKTKDKIRFLKEKKSDKCTLRVQTDTIVPNNYIGYITCTGNLTGDVFIENSLRLKEGEESEIPCCVLRIEKDGTCKVPITNISRNTILIKGNDILARGYTCHPEEENSTEPVKHNLKILLEKDLNIDDKLSAKQKEELITLINKYKECFATSMNELGCAINTKMAIKLNNNKPISYRPYRMAHIEREKVKDMIIEMKEAGIVKDSDSPYSSPILLVNKPDGTKRLCIDYRKLNAITEKDRHPLPLIDDQIDQLRGYKYYTTLDLYSGYYQVEMDDDSKEKTAFVTCDGQYEFNRMPFGLTNAPSVFQRLINRVLGPLRGTIAMAYLDDILCPGKTFKEGLENLELVFKTLKENNLTLNPKKCFFFKTIINYLGFEITREGVKPGLLKIKAVMNFPIPKNVHNIRQFLGLTGFFRRFIEKYAHIAKPLSILLHKEQPWKWDEEQQSAFQALKNKLIERPILAIYDSKLETEVHTDACQNGIAGILLQKVDDLLKPIGYFSRQLTATESKWHSYELETLAVVETLKRYRVYLLGLHFKVVTDCSAIKSAAEKRDLIPKIARWWLQLQEFSFKIEHRNGRNMLHVDALSRNAVIDTEIVSENFVFRIETEDWVLAGQMTDKKLQALHKILQKPPADEFEKRIQKEYKIKDNRLYKKVKDKELWVVPKNMRREIVRSCHDEFGHFSTEKTLHKLLETYWFPNIQRYVEKYIASCIKCLYYKVPRGKQEGMMHLIDKPSVPYNTIHVDHLGPFNRSSAGKKYVFVVIDAFTKYVHLTATKDTKTVPVVKFLTQLMTTYGVPTNIVSDRGTCFTSKGFKAFISKMGIKHILNAVATPRANGQVERYNATILASLSTTINNEDEWERKLPQVQFSINNVVNSTTGKTASELLMGYKPRGTSDSLLTIEIQKNRPTTTDLTDARKTASFKTKKSQEKAKERFDKKRKAPKTYEEGELVLVKKARFGEGSKKLLDHYKGPFKITKKLPNDRYVLEEIEGSHRSQRAPYKNIEAVDKLKKWIPVDEISSSSNEEEL